MPRLTTAIFGLGGHDLQPRHPVAALFKNMESGKGAPLIYLGSQFFSKNPAPRIAELQSMKEAYPETVAMALKTEVIRASCRIRPSVRFHSVGAATAPSPPASS